MTFFCVSFVFIFIGCRKKPTQLPDKRFTQSELNILPYIGTETLTFKNIAGDSVLYTGQGKKSNLYMVHELNQDYEENRGKGDFRNVETVYLSFKKTNSNATIDIYLSFPHPFNERENEKNMSIKFNYYDINSFMFNGTYLFEAGSIMSLNHTQYYYISYVTAYHDSLTLANRTYYHVFEMTRDVSDILPQYQDIQITNLYYSSLEGIVGYKIKTGAIWYLK